MVVITYEYESVTMNSRLTHLPVRWKLINSEEYHDFIFNS